MSKNNKFLQELIEQKEEIDKKANRLILRCYDIVYWEKDKPIMIQFKISEIEKKAGIVKLGDLLKTNSKKSRSKYIVL